MIHSNERSVPNEKFADDDCDVMIHYYFLTQITTNNNIIIFDDDDDDDDDDKVVLFYFSRLLYTIHSMTMIQNRFFE